jgi:hypothetical protein
MRHLGAAQSLAQSYYRRDHSNEAGGAQEDIPRWARAFFPFFEAQQSQASRNARTIATRNERRTTATSIMGRSAPLGTQGNGPAQLRNETTRNGGAARMRQQVVGEVNAQRVQLEEGRDDIVRRSPAPLRQPQNGVRRRNVLLGGSNFSPGSNDPSSRFNHIIRGFDSLDALSTAVAQAVTPSPNNNNHTSRSIIEVVRDYSETARYMGANGNAHDEFFNSALAGFNDELRQIRAIHLRQIREMDGVDHNLDAASGGDVDESNNDNGTSNGNNNDSAA